MATQVASLFAALDLRDSMTPALDQARGNLSSFVGGIRGAGDSLAHVGAGMTALTLPLTAFGVSGIRAAADFDVLMKQIEVFGGVTGEELEAVRRYALQMGTDTQFAGSDAAAGLLDLMKSGQSLEQAMATLPPVLDLAAVGQMSIAEATGIASTALAQFGLETGEVERVSDALARAANASRADVRDLGQALANGGTVAAQYGLSVEQTTAVLGVFSNASIEGAEAGTQLKSMLMNMGANTPAVTNAWATLGTSLYDANGNLRDIDTVLDEVDAALDQLPVEEQNRLMEDLAGSYGITGLNALRAAGGIDEMLAVMAAAPPAADLAAGFMDTFAGTMDSLGGSVEALQFGALTPFMNDVLKPLAQRVTAVINKITAWSLANPELTKKIVAFGAALIVIGPALMGAGIAIGFLTSPIALVVAAVAVLAVAWETNFGGIRDIAQSSIASISQVFSAFRHLITGFVSAVGNFGLADALRGLFGEGLNIDTQESLFEGFLTMLGMDRDLAIGIIRGLWDRLQIIFDGASRIFNAIRPAFSEFFKFISNIFSQIDFGKIFQIGSALASLTSPVGIVLAAFKLLDIDVIQIIENVAGAITRFFGTLNDGGSLGDAFRAAFGTPEEIGGKVTTFVNDIGVKIAEFVQAAIVKVGELSQAFIDWVGPLIPPMLAKLGEFLGSALDWILNTAIPGAVVGLLGLGQAFIDWIGPLIPPLLVKLGEFLGGVLDWILNTAIPGAIVGLLGLGTAFIEWLGPVVVDILPRLGNFLGAIIEWLITTGVPGAIAGLLALGEAFIGWIADIIPLIAPALRTFLEAIGTYITTSLIPGVVGFALGIGAGIMQGIREGIGSIAAWFETNVLAPVREAFAGLQIQINAFTGNLSGEQAVTYGASQGSLGLQGVIAQRQTPQTAPYGYGMDPASANRVPGAGAMGSPTGRDVGGAGVAGRPYAIGPQQMNNEVFVPSTNGQFIPDFMKNVQAMAAGGGGDQITVNVTADAMRSMPDARAKGYDLAQGIMERKRAMG